MAFKREFKEINKVFKQIRTYRELIVVGITIKTINIFNNNTNNNTNNN